MQRIVYAGAALTVAAVVGAAAWLALAPQSEPMPPVVMNTGDTEFGGPFELTDHTGARVTSDAVIDGPTLIYFGYTFCPDVCPIDTANMVEAVARLEADGIAVTPVFITVDPARDDAEALGHWVEAHHPAMIGLTGTEAEIEAVADAYRVYFDRVEAGDSAAGYLMNHTAYMYVATREGVLGVLDNGAGPEAIAEGVRAVLDRAGAV